MSNEILINQESFINAINSISDIVNNLENIKSNITNANNGLKENWKGKASKEFYQQSETIANTFADYTEGLISLCEDLNTVLTEFTENDSKIASNITQGGEGIVPIK
ncbi:WXG100 family type VII secretion target [Clostridium perfringens]